MARKGGKGYRGISLQLGGVEDNKQKRVGTQAWKKTKSLWVVNGKKKRVHDREDGNDKDIGEYHNNWVGEKIR